MVAGKQWRMALVMLAFGLAACEPGGAGTATPASTAVNDTGGDASTEVATPAASAAPADDGPPPQSDMAILEGAGQREEITRLSNMLGFKLAGQNDKALGTITDYVVNTCETYIVYMVVQPDAALNVAGGDRVLIPYEAATINSGVVNANTKTITLAVAPEAVAGAPAVTDPLALYPNEWEDGMRTYWQDVVRVGKLSSACQAGGSTPEDAIHKVAYASDLLGAELKDGNGVLLGTVQEAILAPETGKLAFYVVELTDSQGLVLVPIGKTNIPDAALEPGATTELVLLADTSQLTGAPQIDSADAATSEDAQTAARGYWGQ
jgi:sporulation protein YlmC with PRC-barrel domain